MDVSIIIVNWNTSDMLRDCLRSIPEKTSGIEYEVIVVDNASSDGSPEMVRSDFPSVRLLEAGSNLGFGRANNLGAGIATGAFLFFLNSDTVLLNNAIFELFAFMKAHPDCGIAGGNLTDAAGRPIHSHSKALPSPFADLSRLVPFWPRLVRGRNWTYNHSGKPLRVAYVTGADLMIGSALFAGVGGFDPGFFMYYEETELMNRVRKQGLIACSVPAAKITHIKGGSLENLDSVKDVVYASKYLYMRKVFGAWGVIAAHCSFSFFCIVKICLTALAGKKKSVRRYREMLAAADRALRSETV